MAKYVLKKHQPRLTWLRFPRINRFINDRPKLSRKWKIAAFVFCSFILLVLLSISTFDLYDNFQKMKKHDLERKKITSQIQYWQGIASKHKDYRDAYFQLAILEYQLKDFDKSKFYLDKALNLDPSFEKGRELEKVLSSK